MIDESDKRFMMQTLKASSSALPFWFAPFYAGHINRSFFLDRFLGKPPAVLTWKIFLKSFGYTAILQPYFPLVNLACRKLSIELFNESVPKSLVAIVTVSGILGIGSAIAACPLDIRMIMLRSGQVPLSPKAYFRGIGAFSLRNSLFAANLFMLAPIVGDKFFFHSDLTRLESTVAASILTTSLVSLGISPLNTYKDLLAKDVSLPVSKVRAKFVRGISRHGLQFCYAGAHWTTLALIIETTLFSWFLKQQ